MKWKSLLLSKFEQGAFLVLALYSLVQDWYGQEDYVFMIQAADWMSPYLTVPFAIAGLIYICVSRIWGEEPKE